MSAEHLVDTTWWAAWNQHRALVSATVLRVVRDREIACDVEQDVWLQIWRSRAQYRGQAALSTWVYCIARSRALNELRASRRRAMALAAAATEAAMAAESVVTDTPVAPALRARHSAEFATASSMSPLVREALASMPDGQRMVFLRAALGEEPLAAIAADLGIQPGTARSQMLKARRRLQVMLLALRPAA